MEEKPVLLSEWEKIVLEEINNAEKKKEENIKNE